MPRYAASAGGHPRAAILVEYLEPLDQRSRLAPNHQLNRNGTHPTRQNESDVEHHGGSGRYRLIGLTTRRRDVERDLEPEQRRAPLWCVPFERSRPADTRSPCHGLPPLPV